MCGKKNRAEAFDKVCNALNKVYNLKQSGWDLHVPRQMPFRLVDGVEAIIPMESIMSSPRIVEFTEVMDCGALEERLA